MKAYISCLSTDNYLKGVLVLHQSLLESGTKYPFYCLVSDMVSQETCNIMEQRGIKLIIKKGIEVSEWTNQPMTGWDYTYFKFRLFELVEFEKLVYLDADTLVLKNIDDLFEKDTIAVCKDGYQFTGVKNNELCGCNSGVMVITPDMEMYNALINELPCALARGMSGDQGIINEFLGNNIWLPEYYNMTPNMIDKACYRERYFNFKYKDICVVHFIWKIKPFFEDKLSLKRFFNMLCRLHFYEIKVNMQYYRIMTKLKKDALI